MWMLTWQALYVTDNARHVIGCQLSQETRVHNVDDDVAGIICQALK